MDKKKLMYIGGALLVVGAGLYLWNKSKGAKVTSTSRLKSDDSTTSDSTTSDSKTSDSKTSDSTKSESLTTPPVTTPPVTTPISDKKLSDFEVNALLLRECGKKPVLNIKNKIERYETCKNKFKDRLKSAGMISFDGGEYMGMATLKKGLPPRRTTRPRRIPFDGEFTDVFEPVASFDAFEPLI